MPTPTESLISSFLNCVYRKCTKEQLESFLERARIKWAGNDRMQGTIDELQKQI